MCSQSHKAPVEGSQSFLERMRHSTAHVMAEAVFQLFPTAKIGIGPVIEDGFYYDFDLPRPLTPDDLGEIERRMRDIIATNSPFIHEEWEKDRAREFFKDQPLKLELIDEIGDQKVGIYTQHRFTDLCRGPHVENTRQMGAFKLLNVAGAYWRGDEHRPMLQRIYGTAWPTQEELDRYLWRLEEAKRRDHRRIGKELELFMVSDKVGAGLPLWLPKGATIRRELERYIVDAELKQGYQHVYTPNLAKVELYKTSGHWEHYKESMYPPMELENEQLVLRPMNCPHHIAIYQSQLRSYRDLPIRIAELGTMYRYERSGELSGLSRVRAMTLNDAHIFCRPDQLKSEFTKVVELIQQAYKDLGFKDYWYQLSLWDPSNREKFVDNPAMWEHGERELRQALEAMGLNFVAAPGEAAFYGPKLDVQVRNALGKDETISTVQVDFHMPNQFELEYIGEDGRPHQPVIIHRGIISTMERIVAYLIETHVGALPVWLAPIQAVLIPIADRHLEYTRKVADQLKSAGIRVEVDERSERMNAKIREAQLQKIPYMLIAGDRETANATVSVRLRSGEDLGPLPVEKVIEQIEAQIAAKT